MAHISKRIGSCCYFYELFLGIGSKFGPYGCVDKTYKLSVSSKNHIMRLLTVGNEWGTESRGHSNPRVERTSCIILINHNMAKHQYVTVDSSPKDPILTAYINDS